MDRSDGPGDDHRHSCGKSGEEMAPHHQAAGLVSLQGLEVDVHRRRAASKHHMGQEPADVRQAENIVELRHGKSGP